MTEARSTATLRDYLHAIDWCYFDGHLSDLGVRIQWMRHRGADPTRLGSYWEEARLIEIARCLADPSIPRFYVLHIVHHEGCHAMAGFDHGPVFRQLEKQFQYTYEVAEWERANASVPWPQPPKGLR